MGTQGKLNRYLREQRGKCFQLGKHDCFTFTNGAWAAMHGEGYADHVIGQYEFMGPSSLKEFMLESFGHDNLTDCFDAHMTRVEGVPPRGALVMSDRSSRWFTGKALGIAMGTKAVFLGDLDMVYMHITEIEAAWVK